MSSDSDIYEIDYKGPETHSSVPPPHHYPHSIPRKDIVRAENVFGSATLATNKASMTFMVTSFKLIKSLNFSIYYY